MAGRARTYEKQSWMGMCVGRLFDMNEPLSVVDLLRGKRYLAARVLLAAYGPKGSVRFRVQDKRYDIIGVLEYCWSEVSRERGNTGFIG